MIKELSYYQISKTFQQIQKSISKKMDKSQYQKILREIEECQERSRKTLSNIDSTLLGVKQTLKDIEETNNNIDRVKDEFNTVLEKLCQNIAKSFNNCEQPFKKMQGVQYTNLPQQISEEAVIEKILFHQDILIMTGAGISADSGIPTFRGKGGLYQKKFELNGIEYSPQEFITYKMFEESPQAIWRWIDSIYELSMKSTPNQIHRQIDLLAKLLHQKGKNVVVATQNIDDLHLKPQKNEYQYYNIHGNCKFVRCNDHHFQPYDSKNKITKCPVCDGDIRPHILFFDQKYGKSYGEEIKDKKFPFVICIGSSLKTGLAIGMIQRADQVIEINPEPVIEIGKVYRFTKKTTQVLRKFNSALKISSIEKVKSERK